MKEYTAEQIKAIESVNINTAVVAGAGSGKTSVLVERYIRLVAGGTDCRRILAITFTEKAAGEMSARIRAQMAERAGACAREGDSAGETNWLAQKDLLPRAYIGTIHGLCAGIIRANPMAAGVAPDAQILDESGGRLLLAEAAQAAFARLLPDSAALASLCEEYGYYRVFQYTKSIMEKFTAEETADAGFPGRLAAGCRGALERTAAAKREFFLALDELLSLSDSVKGTKLDGALAQMRRNLAEIEKTLTNLPDDMDSLSFIDALLGKVHRQGKIKLAVDAAKISWEKVVGGCRDCRALKIMPCWAEVLKACAGEFALLKKRRMALTFSDLENIALKTLKEDQTLLRKYMDKYRHIMIDEFQDTSKAQKEIAYLLSGGDAQTLRGEKLFIVGDERQSIYRFRGADVGVFIRARQEMLVNSADAQIELSANFRSREEIIAVCNHLFSCPAPGLSDMGYKPMRIGRIEQEKRAAGEPVELLLVNEAVGGGHEAEAAAIARRLLLLRGEGFSFADMAVILRARTHLSAYTNALEAFGAPYSLLDGQGFFQAPEIIDILNILRFLENCLRDLPLLGLLRSPLFGLDDNAITLVALSGGSEPFWHKLKNFPAGGLNGEQKQLAERAIKILEKLAQAARILYPGPLLRAVIEELRLMPLLLAYPDGRQKYANMEKFVDTAFAFEQETDGGLGEFIAHIDGLSAVGAREGL